jgi:AMP deaminase
VVAAGVSYYVTSAALTALSKERSRLEAEYATGTTSHRRHQSKHHGGLNGRSVLGNANGALASVTPHKSSKHTPNKAAVRTPAKGHRGSLTDNEDGADSDDGGDDEHAGGGTWHGPPRSASPAAQQQQQQQQRLGGSGNSLIRAQSTSDLLAVHPEYHQRILADQALPSRAASRFAAGLTPDAPPPAPLRVAGDYSAASDADGEQDGDGGGMETGAETEVEEGALRRWRLSQAALPLNGQRRTSEDSSPGGLLRMPSADAALAALRHEVGGPAAFAHSPRKGELAASHALLAACDARQHDEQASGSAPAYPPAGRAPSPVPGAAGGSVHALQKAAAAALDADYDRVITPEEQLTGENEEVCWHLAESLALRQRYAMPEPPPEAAVPKFVIATKEDPFHMRQEDMPGHSGHVFAMEAGVMRVWPSAAAREQGQPGCCPVPATGNQFFTDLHHLNRVTASGPVKSFAHRRLALLEQRFSLHLMLNADREFLAQKAAPHRDFYNVRKVDTHVHHSACMNQKHLLRFIKSRLRREPDQIVIFRDGKYLTLADVFRSLRLTSYDLSVDTMDMHADKDTFHRFDRFNLKYNPCGESRLREIFIKQDNLIRGRFLAELTGEVLSDLEANKYQHAEYRISVYGRKATEWDTLAAWVCNHGLYSDNCVWLIQLPRLYSVYKENGTLGNFQELLDNIFTPLFEVTVDPGSHSQLHAFLQTVVGFDMVDDESKPERRVTKHMPTPEQWDVVHDPAYAYYAYYVWANLYALNTLRMQRGMRTLAFRPHAGEAGDLDHLVAAFLLAKNIAHGNNLRKSPGLQYCFYLAQIGLNMSPLSNNSLFLDYHKNPFPQFFARGLPVALSTDDPLQIHLTKEPLVEEYSVAAQVWKLSSCDLCEIARNSVLNSGFSHADKVHWVGDTYWLPGSAGNDTHKTNVPDVRVRFRHETLQAERQLISKGAAATEAQRKAAAEAKRRSGGYRRQ